MKIQITTIMVVAACLSHAQTLTARSSTINQNHVYGFGGNVFNNSSNVTDTNLLLSDTEGLSFDGETSGVFAGTPWSAEVNFEGSHSYSVAGTLSNFTGITASGSTLVQAASSGVGGASQFSNNPGNQIILNFDGLAGTDYTFAGALTLPASEVGAGNFIALQRFDSIVWQNIFTTFSLSGQQGSFSTSGTLIGGQYRLVSSIGMNAGGNESHVANYNYEFGVEAVPEPSLLIGASALAAFLRKRKK